MQKNSLNTFLIFIYKNWLILIFTVLVFMGFRQIFALLLLPVLLFKTRLKYHTDITFYILLIFSFIYSFLTSIYGINDSLIAYLIMYALYPPIFYILGRYLMDKWYNFKYLFLILLIVSFSFTMIYETIKDIFSNGLINVSRGLDLSDSKDATATLIGSKVSLGVTALGLVFAKTEKLVEKRIKYFLAVWGFISLLVTVHLINRTGLVLLFISIIFVVLLNFKNYKKSNILIGLILIVILGFLIYPVLDKYDAIDAYTSREEITDYETKSAGGRTARWVEGIDYIVANPLGGGVYFGGARYYAHNLWLDVGEMAGIIPMVLLIVVTILNLKKSAELVFKNNNLSIFFKSLIGTINIGFFLTCFVEPMYEGNFIYVCAYFSFWGMISIIYNKENFKFSDIQNEN